MTRSTRSPRTASRGAPRDGMHESADPAACPLRRNYRMDKIWLKSYRAGVPAEIDLNEYASLNDVLAQSCHKFRDLPAFRNLGTTITYAELDRLSRHFAAWLAKPVAREGCSRCPDDAQSSAVSRRPVWRPARGNDCGQHQSLIQGPRIGASAQGLRRRSHRHPGKLRARAGKGARLDRGPPRGDHAGWRLARAATAGCW